MTVGAGSPTNLATHRSPS